MGSGVGARRSRDGDDDDDDDDDEKDEDKKDKMKPRSISIADAFRCIGGRAASGVDHGLAGRLNSEGACGKKIDQ